MSRWGRGFPIPLNKELSRRTFLKGGGALIVAFSTLGAAAGRAQGAESPYASNGPGDMYELDAWLTVHADNTVSVKSGAIMQGTDSVHILDALTNLAAAVSAGDATGMDAGIQALNRAFDRANAAQARVGNDERSLDDTKALISSARVGSVRKESPETTSHCTGCWPSEATRRTSAFVRQPPGKRK